MSLAIKFQQVSGEYQKLQVDLSKAIEARQRLDAQLSENELVKQVSFPPFPFPKCDYFTVCNSRNSLS
jgi:hypothetical protein